MKPYRYKALIAAWILAFSAIFALDCHAQVPQFISYQAIVTDTAGNPVEGIIGIRVSIIQHSETGKVVYTERHQKESDKNGFVSLMIGKGDNIYQGKLDTIDWSDGPYFTKVEIAPNGGYIYPISTTSELASVPFAFFALSADSVSASYVEIDPLFAESASFNISAEDTIKWNALSKQTMFKVGDLHQGGIIFYLEPGGEHGLIASLNDVANGVPWGSIGTLTGAESSFDGLTNSSTIVASEGVGDYAAYICDTYASEGYEDWYLPAMDELHLLFKTRYTVNKLLSEDGDDLTLGLFKDAYWTSTERDADDAGIFRFGTNEYLPKNSSAAVRAIRAF